MQSGEIINRLKSMANPANVEGMARYGINPKNALGVSMPQTRKMAKEIGKDHALAQELWETGFNEARILASLIDEPAKVDEAQMERWVSGFESWDVCDQCCSNLFDKTRFGHDKAFTWAERDETYVKRAGFVLMATLSVHDKKASDERFIKFLPVIKRHATDDRNFVKKAVNWALRQIGKRNMSLNKHAIETAREIARIDSKSARWIASDALRELTDDKTRRRIYAKKKSS